MDADRLTTLRAGALATANQDVLDLLAALAVAERDRNRAHEHAQQLHDDMEQWHAALGPVLAGTPEEELEEVLGVRAARFVERLLIQNTDLFRVRAQLLEFEAAATEAPRLKGRLRRAQKALWDIRCHPNGADREQAWRDLAAALDETLCVAREAAGPRQGVAEAAAAYLAATDRIGASWPDGDPDRLLAAGTERDEALAALREAVRRWEGAEK